MLDENQGSKNTWLEFDPKWIQIHVAEVVVVAVIVVVIS